MQYDILRDVLIILGSVMAVFAAIIGGLIFFVLRAALMRDVTTTVSKQVDEECRKLRATADVQLGVIYWIQGAYDKAIDVTKRALNNAGDILDEEKIIFAKSNLGYYFGEKHKKEPLWCKKEEAIELTRIGSDRYSPHIPKFQHPDWVDNYMFVKATFVQTIKERDEVVQLIEQLKLRGDLQPIKAYLEGYRRYVSELRLES